MKVWQLQEAKAKLSKLVKQVINSGPQGISLRGVLEVVLMSRKDYQKITGQKSSFVKFMKSSPLRGLSIDTQRNKSKPRDITL